MRDEERVAIGKIGEMLEELESERRRIHGLLMDGQLKGGMDPIQALAGKVDRLREDFAVLDV